MTWAMARETKVGLLVGMAVILLIGILVSDFLTEVQQPAALDDYLVHSQEQVISGPTIPKVAPAPKLEELILPRRERRALVAERNRQPGGRLDELFSDTPAGEHRTTVIQEPPAEIETAGEDVAEKDTVAVDPHPNRFHDVKPLETLYHIAKRYYGNGEAWRLIRKANPDSVAEDGHVGAGIRLVIPPIGGEEEAETQAPSAERAAGYIIVESGQNLSELAAIHLRDEHRWRELFEANRQVIADPDSVAAGMKLKLPAGSKPAPARKPKAAVAREVIYIVRAGDTLSSIAHARLGDRRQWQSIQDANDLDDADTLQVGQRLKMPGSSEGESGDSGGQ